MEQGSDYNYQTVISILAEMVEGYLINQSKREGEEKVDESSNEPHGRTESN